MKRKPPVKHDVKAHTRKGKSVKSFTRGSGVNRIGRKKVVVGGKTKLSTIQKEILKMIENSGHYLMLKTKSGFNARRFVQKKKRLTFEQLDKNFNYLVEMGLIEVLPYKLHRETCYGLVGTQQEDTQSDHLGSGKGYKTVPVGECYDYVFKMTLKGIVEDDKDFKIIHATVEEPFAQPPRSYTHAWIEREGRVYDWQTMVVGTSKFAGEGWPKDLFYDTFKPRETREYTPKQIVEYTDKFGHTGPWEV